MVKGKVDIARKKIEIKRIEDEGARQVCFSKRRQGLFKKASELSILCGATVGSVVFSNKGTPFSFGHPSINEVVDRFHNLVATGGIATGGVSHDNSGEEMGAAYMRKYLELQQSMDSENKKKEMLQKAIEKEMGKPVMQWLNANVMELGPVELQEFQKGLEAVDGVVKEKTNQITQVSMPQPPMEIATASRYQFCQNISADSMSFTGPSSSNGFIDGFEVKSVTDA